MTSMNVPLVTSMNSPLSLEYLVDRNRPAKQPKSTAPQFRDVDGKQIGSDAAVGGREERGVTTHWRCGGGDIVISSYVRPVALASSGAGGKGNSSRRVNALV